MPHKALVLGGFFFLCSSCLFAGAIPSEWDRYCRKCHIDRPVNSLYDPSIKAHSQVSLSCVGCHRDKGIAGHVKKSTETFLTLFQDMTLPPDVHPSKTSSVTSGDCLGCHPYIREVDEIAQTKLPKAMRPIKLRAAHGQHWDYRTFTPELQDKFESLSARKAKYPLAKTEQTQFDRLSKIEKMQCSRCHERFRKDSPGGVDPNVNIAMKNPMECTACHVALRTAVHPGDASPLPSAVSCERCHNGKLHQKMIFFPVDSGTNDDCLFCHPGYTQEELAILKPAQFIHKSTGELNGTNSKKAGSAGVSPALFQPSKTANQ